VPPVSDWHRREGDRQAASLHDSGLWPRKKLGLEREWNKARVRTKMERAFFFIKQMFGYIKPRCRKLEKNTNLLSNQNDLR